MDATALEKLRSRVLADLEQTPFAAASLRPLSGGVANFIYHATLKQPLADGTVDVLVKHSEDFIASSPTTSLTLFRCRIEEECLRAVSELSVAEKANGTPAFTVRTPKLFHFDEQNNTQIQEILRDGKNLKTYALSTYSAKTPDTARPHCVQLGQALGKWLRNFHVTSAASRELRSTVAANKDLQQLKHVINYSWLLDRVEKFPTILREAKDIFEKVKEMAAKELEDESQLQPIHGDFWTGNIVLPDKLIEEGSDVTMFVIDWEMAQIGVKNLDIGQMIGELYQLKLYKDMAAGLWIMQGFVDGYGEVSDDFAFRTAIQVGAHLVSFGLSVQGWGTPEQVEMVARTGRDIIVHAWHKDREWFERGDLACLFWSATTKVA